MGKDKRDDSKDDAPKPLPWSFDGFNYMPTSWKGWVVIAGGAVVIGVLISVF